VTKQTDKLGESLPLQVSSTDWDTSQRARSCDGKLGRAGASTFGQMWAL